MSQTLISARAKLAKTDGVRDGSSYQSGGKDLVWLDAVSIVCHFQYALVICLQDCSKNTVLNEVSVKTVHELRRVSVLTPCSLLLHFNRHANANPKLNHNKCVDLLENRRHIDGWFDLKLG